MSNDNNREFIDERFNRVWDRFAADSEAMRKAETALENYKKVANEFRGALSDQANTFLTRTEYTARHETLLQRVAAVEKKADTTESRYAGRSAGINSIGVIVIGCISGGAGIVAIASLVFNVLKAAH